jgi:hypothetical protein
VPRKMSPGAKIIDLPEASSTTIDGASHPNSNAQTAPSRPGTGKHPQLAKMGTRRKADVRFRALSAASSKSLNCW